jgi:hypothetical protein
MCSAALAACDAGSTGPGADAAVDAAAPDAAAWVEPFDARAEGALLSVWGFGEDDVYAVGGQPKAGVAWRFDGTAWAGSPCRTARS